MHRDRTAAGEFGIGRRGRRGAAVATALALMASLVNAALVVPPAGAAPGVPPVTYATGDIDGQNGWAGTAGGNINDSIDQEVVANSGAPASFEDQSWRISNAFTTGSFGDQTFTPSVTDEAGETAAANDGLSGGTRQDRFEAEWDFSSASPGGEQTGLSIVASPDRGDGARMSWVRMTDAPGGLEVGFYDYQRAIDPECDGPGDPFVFTSVATGLDRSTAHNIRVVMDFVDGIANDVVEVYVDDALVHTGTSWEDYFRDCESNPTRTVDSLLFRSSGTAAPGTAGSGFLIDNVATRSADQGTDTTASEFSTGFEPVLTSTTIEVTEADEVDWFAADTRAAGDLEFNTTYGGQIGNSAAIFSTTADNADKVQLLTDLFDDTLLSDIDGLGYSTYRDSASAGGAATLPSLNLRVDTDDDDIVDTYLIYEPYQDLGNAAVSSDIWQTWDAIRGGDAKWWASHIPACGQATPCTWDTIVSTYPDARVLEDPDSPVNSGSAPDPGNLQGSLGVNLGSFNPSITAAADALSVTVSGHRQIFDFKAIFAPEAPTGLSATPGDGVVDLSWTAPDDGGSPITTYRVYRDSVEVGTTSGATTFQDTTANGAVPSSVAYSYTVSAENAVDEGPESSAANATVHLFWKGLEWELMNGTAVVNGADGVDLTRLGSGTAWIHLIGDPPVNSAGTPWVEWSYVDDGTSWPGIDMFIDSEVPDPNPRVQTGSLFTADTLGYARYGLGGGLTEEIVFPTVDPGPGPRSGDPHTIYVGQAPTGRIDYEADGVRHYSDLLIGNGSPFVWKDVILRWRCDATASVPWERVCTGGETITFDDFTFGDDHDFVAPEVTITTPADGATFEHNESVAADFVCEDEVGGSGIDTCVGDVADGADIDTSTLGDHDFTVTGTDVAGNETVVTHSYTVEDVTAPVITITTPVDGGSYDRGAAVPADFSCVDEAGGSGVALCFGTVPDGVNINTSTLGSHTFQVFSFDNAGNLVAATADYTVVDGTDPTVTITSPADGATFALDESVAADFVCEDEVGGSGIDTCVGDVADGADIDTSTLGAHDFTVTGTDVAGNETVVTHDYTVLDVTDPTVTIITPADGEIVEQDDVLLADYECTDEVGGSGIDTCVGDVADGAAVDTSTPGAQDFTVTGTDNDGNETVVVHSYSVCAGHPFSDVDPWVTDAVDWAWCNMYMTGLPGNLFGTNDPMTRGQVARMLYRVAGSPDVSALPPNGFTDVPAWVEDAVTWLVANNYATGYDDNTFRPNLPISRAQVTRMQFRVAGSPAGSPAHGFSDVEPWVNDAVDWVVDPAHVPPYATGYDDNTYRPNINISRGQVARMTCRINATPGTC